jgi:CRP-like cAMP-binding protein
MPTTTASTALRASFERLAGGPLPHWDALDGVASRRALSAGEVLFHAGAPHPHIVCVIEGVLKMVYDTDDGKCWIKAFAEPGLSFASLTALREGGRASFTACAVGAALIERVPYAAVDRLATQHTAWQRLLANAFRLYGERKEQRELELLTLSAEERYQRFAAEHPALEAMLAQHEVAAYVRVTPVALSRIKARLRRAAAATAPAATGAPAAPPPRPAAQR